MAVCLLSSAHFVEVVERLRAIAEVMDACFTTGPYHILTCLRCRDDEHLRTILHDTIQQLEGIERTKTLALLDELFTRPIALRAE